LKNVHAEFAEIAEDFIITLRALRLCEKLKSNISQILSESPDKYAKEV